MEQRFTPEQKSNLIWIIFGNADDGIYGDDRWVPPGCYYPNGIKVYKPELTLFGKNLTIPIPFISFGNIERIQYSNPWKAFWWWLRNPLHNFTHYVIGVADQEHTYVGPDMDSQGFIKAYVLYNGRKLPFYAFNYKGLFSYIGWRPSGGFGIKLIYRKQG